MSAHPLILWLRAATVFEVFSQFLQVSVPPASWLGSTPWSCLYTVFLFFFTSVWAQSPGASLKALASPPITWAWMWLVGGLLGRSQVVCSRWSPAFFPRLCPLFLSCLISHPWLLFSGVTGKGSPLSHSGSFPLLASLFPNNFPKHMPFPYKVKSAGQGQGR